MATMKDGNYLMEEMPHHQKSLVSVWTHDATGERRVWGAGIGMFLADAFARGYKFTPLVLATPARIKSLEYMIRFAEIGVGHDQYDSDLQVIKELIAEMKGEATDGSTN